MDDTSFLDIRQSSSRSDSSNRNKDGKEHFKVFKGAQSKEMDDVVMDESHIHEPKNDEKIVHNTIWRTIVLICELILLFGFEIRDLFCPAESDVAFDVIFMLTFVLLLFDIILMSIALPEYFDYGFSDKHHFRIIFGSWPFWLDFLSALTVLNEITFINTMRARSEEFNIMISADDDGAVSYSNGVSYGLISLHMF